MRKLKSYEQREKLGSSLVKLHPRRKLWIKKQQRSQWSPKNNVSVKLLPSRELQGEKSASATQNWPKTRNGNPQLKWPGEAQSKSWGKMSSNSEIVGFCKTISKMFHFPSIRKYCLWASINNNKEKNNSTIIAKIEFCVW
jgi:hypothetical protein